MIVSFPSSSPAFALSSTPLRSTSGYFIAGRSSLDATVLPSSVDARFVSFSAYSQNSSFCSRVCGLKRWIFKNLNIQFSGSRHGKRNRYSTSKFKDKRQSVESSGTTSSHEADEQRTASSPNDPTGGSQTHIPQYQESHVRFDGSVRKVVSQEVASLLQTHGSNFFTESSDPASLSIAVIGATGELARAKIFPALFALYYSGFLPKNVNIFGYARKELTDEQLRSLIASTLTCRIDHQENCEDKMETFLSRTFYINGGYDNCEGMSKLNSQMNWTEDQHKANRIFYLSVPQEALLDVASCIAMKAQSQKGWNRIIIEKPFGLDATSSSMLTRSLLSKFEEKQIYRIDHLLGRNLIENLTVLRFSNLVFEPLWSRKYVHNVEVVLSEKLNSHMPGRYVDGYGVIRDLIHSHILQTVALLAMEPPVSLDGEDIRNEKVKVLRSIRTLKPSDVILGQYKAMSEDHIDIALNNMAPTFFAAALYIENARWDGVPFLIKAGTGLIRHRMEIRIQFHHVPGNIYRDCMGQNINQAINELILRDVPDEAILVRINNKVPGLGLQLDASELNLPYKDKYDLEVPDSYEHLLLDVIDGDNHLFMRSDELAAAWNILTPVLQEIDKNNITPELYELGGRGPVGAYYLWAKHGVRWLED